MKMFCPRLLLFLVLGLVPMLSPAALELELTIEGTPEEIMAILEVLQERGLLEEEAEAPDDAPGLRFEMQSSMEGAGDGAADGDTEAEAAEETAPAAPAPPPPVLRLENPTVVPEKVEPEQEAVVSVIAVDEAHVIDTMSARFFGSETVVDLYDNGTHGDGVANDQQWSGVIQIPEDAPIRSQRVDIMAYDADGQELPVMARTRLQVVRPEPEPEPAPTPEAAPAAPDTETPPAPETGEAAPAPAPESPAPAPDASAAAPEAPAP